MSYTTGLGDILPFLQDVTLRAGKTIMGYFEGDFAVQSKDTRVGGVDIVTDADRASEDLIVEAVRREFPGHDILTEESPPETHGSSYRWLIDPLDGTVNFSHGYPQFCVSLALMENGALVAGIVYDPVRKESFHALRGQGAFLNGRAIGVSDVSQLNRSIVATGFPYDKAFSPENNVAEFSRVIFRIQGMRRGGSAALDLAWVACGRLDGFWELKLKPWDMAAGMLLVDEAGGRVSDRDGKPTDPYTQCLVATNGKIHDFIVNLLE